MDRFKSYLTDPLIIGILIAFWGGVTKGISCRREDFTWYGFLFRVVAAGFVGVLTGLVMKHIDYPV